MDEPLLIDYQLEDVPFTVSDNGCDQWAFPCCHLVRIDTFSCDRIAIHFATQVVEIVCADSAKLLQEILVSCRRRLFSVKVEASEEYSPIHSITVRSKDGD